MVLLFCLICHTVLRIPFSYHGSKTLKKNSCSLTPCICLPAAELNRLWGLFRMLKDVSPSCMSEANFTTLSYICASLLCQVSSLTVSGKSRMTASALHSKTEPSSYQVSLFETARQTAPKYCSSRPCAKLLPSITLRDRSPRTMCANTNTSQRW